MKKFFNLDFFFCCFKLYTNLRYYTNNNIQYGFTLILGISTTTIKQKTNNIL